MSRAPVIAISHGGGPGPLLGDTSQADTITSLKHRVPQILGLESANKPRAIVICTAHWSGNKPTISSGSRPQLYYDYGGFPPEAFKLKYDAPGSPEVASEVAEVMTQQGLDPVLDDERGWDHGVFVPLLLIRPQADIPIVQISVLSSEDPSEHFAMGRALEKLRESNIAIIGSGLASFHNIRLLFSGEVSTPDFQKRNWEFSQAVTNAATAPDPDMRINAFKVWRTWSHAYEMHPQNHAEHFFPLIVAAGAGGNSSAKYYKDRFMGFDSYSYHWD